MNKRRPDWFTVIAITRERADRRLCVPVSQRSVIATDDITRMIRTRAEDRRPEMTQSVRHPAAEVGTEYDGPIIGRFGDHRDGPGLLTPVAGHVRKQFNDRPVPGDGGSDGFSAKQDLCKQGLT